jgi:hypothetical protein
MILFKKQLLDLEVKGQGPMKVITVRDTPPYGHAPTYQISLTYLERQKCYSPDKKILFEKQLFDLEVKVSRRSLRYATHRLMVMHPHTWINPSKKQLFDLEVKVPRRSLWYAAHRLMVMHPHTKYHWLILKDKNVIARTRKYYLKNNYLTLRSKSHKGHYGMWHTTLCLCTNIFERYYLKKQLFDLEVKGQGPTKVITVCDTPSYGHTPILIIIDLSRKTKMLWLGQENTI